MYQPHWTLAVALAPHWETFIGVVSRSVTLRGERLGLNRRLLAWSNLAAPIQGAYLLRRGIFMPWELPEVLGPDLAREGLRRLDRDPATSLAYWRPIHGRPLHAWLVDKVRWISALTYYDGGDSE